MFGWHRVRMFGCVFVRIGYSFRWYVMIDKVDWVNTIYVLGLTCLGLGLVLLSHYYLQVKRERLLKRLGETREELNSKMKEMDDKRDYMIKLSQDYLVSKAQFKKLFVKDWTPYTLKFDEIDGVQVDADLLSVLDDNGGRTDYDVDIVLTVIRFRLNGLCSYRRIYEEIQDFNDSVGRVHRRFKVSEKRIREIVKELRYTESNGFPRIVFVNQTVYDAYYQKRNSRFWEERERVKDDDTGLKHFFIVPATIRGGHTWVMVEIGDFFADKSMLSAVNSELEPKKLVLSVANGELRVEK